MKAEEKSDYMESYHKSLKETEEMMHTITIRNQIFNNVEGAVLEMHEWDKKRFIEWATEWLKHNIYDHFYWIEMEGESEANIKDTLFNDFKKDAEEQL